MPAATTLNRKIRSISLSPGPIRKLSQLSAQVLRSSRPESRSRYQAELLARSKSERRRRPAIATPP